jgi:hypothetical protein
MRALTPSLEKNRMFRWFSLFAGLSPRRRSNGGLSSYLSLRQSVGRGERNERNKSFNQTHPSIPSIRHLKAKIIGILLGKDEDTARSRRGKEGLFY